MSSGAHQVLFKSVPSVMDELEVLYDFGVSWCASEVRQVMGQRGGI